MPKLAADDLFTNRLRALCRRLASEHTDGTFRLSRYFAAGRLGLTDRGALSRINFLLHAGEIELVEAGDRKSRRASRYRLRGLRE
jgi:hypothetical protein